ncbi:Transcription cofactor vestigial-like protein 3, partial [Frankliniella fusca]
VTTLASNDLRLELVPAAPVEAPETPDEGDDEYDGRRLEFPLGPSVPDDGGDRGAIANPGMQVVSLIRQDAARRGSTANASCTLALYVQGEVAWAVNLCDPKTVDDANHPDGALAKMPSGLSLVWTPPRPGQTVRAAALSITAVRKEVPADNLCSVGSVKLAGRGLESAVALELRDGRAPEDRAEPCRVAVEAPGTYLLSLLLVRAAAAAEPANSASSYSSSADSLEADDGPLEDVENAEDAATEDAAPALDRAACGLSVIVGCSTQDPLWSVDLCDPEAAAALNSTELFSSHVTLVWTSPPLPGPERGSPATTPFASTIILTAIGRGIVPPGVPQTHHLTLACIRHIYV